MNKTKMMLQSIREVLHGGFYKLLFATSLFIMYYLLILIPAYSVPGNSVSQQWLLFTPLAHALLLLLSVLYALFITMQVYVFRTQKNVGAVGASVGGGIGAIVAGVASTAFCASCLAPLFAFFGLGFGATIFVLQYGLYIASGVIILMLLSIYLTAKKINKVC